MKGDKGGEGLKEGVWTDRDKEMRREGGKQGCKEEEEGEETRDIRIEGGRGKKERGRQREREEEKMKREGKRDMQMWCARLRRGRKSHRNGVGVGNMRGQRDREWKKE